MWIGRQIRRPRGPRRRDGPSNEDVPEAEGTEETQRGVAGGQGEERTREGGGKRRGNTR